MKRLGCGVYSLGFVVDGLGGSEFQVECRGGSEFVVYGSMV